MSWEAAEKYGVLPAAVSVTKGENLFPRIDMEKELAALEALKAPKADPIEPFKPNVVFDDFEKCDFRVCRVLKCEAVKKSQKLLRFELDDGSGTTRQILSGIAMHYKPEDGRRDRQPAAAQDDGARVLRHAALRRAHGERQGRAASRHA